MRHGRAAWRFRSSVSPESKGSPPRSRRPRQRVPQALNFLATPLFTVVPSNLAANVREARLPAIHQWPEMADAGALAGYGPPFVEVFRQRARMVVKVLRGAKPADIPVEQPTRFELVINLQAAKAIGHDVPAGLVLRADRVIE
jgi:putative ABC transport system substrate-binding protein